MKFATLAIGTEVTDGQVIDRNSAWLSERVTEYGYNVIEHRTVPDERAMMAQAIFDLIGKCDVLAITGGLGPTSDDFTREVVAEVAGKPLVFDAASWEHIEAMLSARGIEPKPIQRQQCFFPEGSQILKNTAGTANGFNLQITYNLKDTLVYVLPGPPLEIAAIWRDGLAESLRQLLPEGPKEDLMIWRCLGRGESDIAEQTEKALGDSGLRRGYRAHMPYVEVKIWVPREASHKYATYLAALEAALAPWLVNRNDEDVAADAWRAIEQTGLRIADAATRGVLATRLFDFGREHQRGLRQANEPAQQSHLAHPAHHGLHQFMTEWREPVPEDLIEDEKVRYAAHFSGPALLLFCAASGAASGATSGAGHGSGQDSGCWLGIRLKDGDPVHWQLVAPTLRFALETERARKFITEKSLWLLGQSLQNVLRK